jgi:NagD protein
MSDMSIVSAESSKNCLIDMDGVLVSGSTMIPGADAFIERLQSQEIKFLVLTNNPLYTPGDLAHRLKTLGLNVPAGCIFTSAMATARFLQAQKPDGTAFVIGESGLTEAVHDVGYVLTDIEPDYVVLGETHSYNLGRITKAVRLIAAGSRFIATNPDPSAPSDEGVVPACGAMAALIEAASGKSPFYVGKPNPLMMRTALNYLDVHSEDTVMIGDRMDTDIVAGVESGMETILVLSGVTAREDIDRYPYQPTHVVESVADIEF